MWFVITKPYGTFVCSTVRNEIFLRIVSVSPEPNSMKTQQIHIFSKVAFSKTRVNKVYLLVRAANQFPSKMSTHRPTGQFLDCDCIRTILTIWNCLK